MGMTERDVERDTRGWEDRFWQLRREGRLRKGEREAEPLSPDREDPA